MNKYKELKEKHQREINNFPIKFAFSDEQFKQAMEEFGFSLAKRDYVGKVASIGGGGFIRIKDNKALHELLDKQENERVEAIESDLTGEGFIKDMFRYELANHEYGYTCELEPTLNALDLTMDDIENSPTLKHGLQVAKAEFR